MAEWMPKSARPYRPASAKPDVSGVESFARGAYQGAGMGFADEQAGALDALGGHLKRTFTNDWKRTGKGWLEDIKAEFGQVTDDYQQGRDESRRAYGEAEEANPTAYGAGQFGGAVATGIATGGASSLGKAGLKGALTAGALEGGASGLGSSEADLTQQDVDAYARAFTDAAGGAALGAPLAGAGYGVAKGLKAVGGKAVDSLRRARGELTEGIAAERSLADDAARVAEEKAQGRLVKDEYAARNQNARLDKASQRQGAMEAAKRAREEARAARDSQRAAQQEVRAQSVAEREAERAAESRTTVDKGLRNLDRENRAAAEAEERLAAQNEREAAAAARESDRFANARTGVDRNLRDLHRENQAAARAASRPPPRAVRKSPPEGPVEDPNTQILGGYRGKAGERRAVNYDRVRQYRQDIADPNFSGDRGRLEEYARQYGDAVDNPAAFERRMVERYLRENYPAEVADRILRERVGPGGEILPRRSPTAEPGTQAADMGDAFKQGRGPEVARQGGGGSAFGQDYPADARTVADLPPEGWDASPPRSGDEAADARTQFGLAAVGRTEPGANGVDEYRFIDPKTDRAYQLEASESAKKPGVISLDYVGPEGVDAYRAMGAGYDAAKNQAGPGVMRKVVRELQERYPDAERLEAARMTGWHGDRAVSMPLPRGPQAAADGDEFTRAIRSRNQENLPAAARRAAQEWETAPQTQVDGLPEIPRGMRRLYRGTAEGGRSSSGGYAEGSLNAEDIRRTEGRWFTDRAGVAQDYARRASEGGGGRPIASYLDVPEGAARRFRTDGMHEGRFADEAFREWLPPREAAESALPMRVPQGPVAGLEEGMNANVPFWDRGIGDDVFLSPERVRGDGLTQRINFETERTQTGRGGPPPAAPRPQASPQREAPVSMDDLRDWTGTPPEPRAAPEALPDVEELTQPGRPFFPRDPSEMARRSPIFTPLPTPRGAAIVVNGQEWARAGAEPPHGAPTRNLRPGQPQVASPPRPAPQYDPNNSMVAPRDFDADTVVPLGDTQVPRAPRRAPYSGATAPELAPEPIQVQPMRQARPRPLAPPVAPPAQTVMGAPPGSLVRQARPSVGELAGQREASALGDVARAGWEGARGANNALAAPFGAAVGISKEALENPAVRARAITAFRLDRLARVRPEVWARVGPTLQRAMQAGPERYKAERHVLLLRDPEFRAAEAEADAELETMDGQAPTGRTASARR